MGGLHNRAWCHPEARRDLKNRCPIAVVNHSVERKFQLCRHSKLWATVWNVNYVHRRRIGSSDQASKCAILPAHEWPKEGQKQLMQYLLAALL